MNTPQKRTPGGSRACADQAKENTDSVPEVATQVQGHGLPVYTGTREDWANRVLDRLVPDLSALGIQMPEGRTVRIGIVPLSKSRLGFCAPAAHSASGTVNFIGLCTKQAEPSELVHTLIHEYLHACDDCQSGHRNRWKRWAEMLGMQAKGHARNAMCESMIRGALSAIGRPVQHEASKTRTAGLALPSQVRVDCHPCGQHVYIPRRAFEGGYAVCCGVCSMQMFQPAAKLPGERR
jgi:hypothetical protein